nr:MAG TPA: Putative transcriptional regulator GENOMICS, TETR, TRANSCRIPTIONAL REGULATOR.65A [Caudoviricetes sp.]
MSNTWSHHSPPYLRLNARRVTKSLTNISTRRNSPQLMLFS